MSLNEGARCRAKAAAAAHVAPKFVLIRGDKMLFQGFERVGGQDDPDSSVVKQEWAAQVMVAQPAELALYSHRMAS